MLMIRQFHASPLKSIETANCLDHSSLWSDIHLIIFFGISFGCAIEFRMVTRELCKLPTFFTTVLFDKIDKESTGFVTR